MPWLSFLERLPVLLTCGGFPGPQLTGMKIPSSLGVHTAEHSEALTLMPNLGGACGSACVSGPGLVT